MNALWELLVNDATVIGWLTVGAYFGAAGLCGLLALRIDRLFFYYRFQRHRVIWWGFALLLLLLGLNKQFDIQTAITRFGRELAYVQGWYNVRRLYQIWFVAGVAGVGFVALIGLTWVLRQVLRLYWLTLLGFVALLTFILIRAASFHYVDKALALDLAGFKANWALELGGIGLIILSVLLNLAWARRAAQLTDPVAAIGGLIYRRDETGALELLLVEQQPDLWTLPRGMIAPGEDRATAINAAMQETVGIEGKVGPLVQQIVQMSQRSRRKRRRVVSYYLIQARPGQALPTAETGDETVRWFPIGAALRQLPSSRLRGVVRAARPLLKARRRQQPPLVPQSVEQAQ
ncbi:MAG: NUDIX domain-containing protein [Chloroflexaceae bacterium]